MPVSRKRKKKPETPQQQHQRQREQAALQVYSGTARTFHWLMFLLIAAQVPVGITMAYRGNILNVWDATTNNLYSGHKLVGMVLLGLAILRLGYRLTHGAPPDEPTLEAWQKGASHATHWMIYLLLLGVPVLGWLGVSYFPALDIFGRFKLPALVSPDDAMAAKVLRWHAIAAIGLASLIAMHVAAALYHYLIRGDNVLARMIPRLMRKG